MLYFNNLTVMLTGRLQIILLNISGCYTGNRFALTV